MKDIASRRLWILDFLASNSCAAAILVGAFLAYFRFIMPLIEIRGILRRLADGDFRPVLLSAPQENLSGNVRRCPPDF